MKTSLTIVLCLFIGMIWAQEPNNKEIKTEVSEVTVFIDGAQVTRKKTVDVEAGKTTLKFTNLSPFIDAQSIQVKAHGEVTVLSVNHQQNYLSQSGKSSELIELEKKLQAVDDNIKLEKTYQEILKEELSFLQINKEIGGKNQELSVATLKEAAAFYGSKFKELKVQEIERIKTISELTKERNQIQNQIQTINREDESPSNEIWVSVSANQSSKVQFEVTYLVNNAGWYPSYDIRAESVNRPLEINYKANVWQRTQEDWKNVKLTFSSSDPNRSGVAPTLYPNYLRFTLPQPPKVISIVSISDDVDIEEEMEESQAFMVTQGNEPAVAQGIKKAEKRTSLPVPSVQVQKQTTVNFEIKTPYTIPSDNKNYTVDMEVYQLPANFQYYCVPKVDRDAFLVAHLTNWEQYNLLEGEANIFFEGTYVGKSLLNLTNATDTLQLSLGRDKQVSVTREKVKDFTTKQFIGNKKEENRAWKTTVRNNKNQPINMILLDQVPISTLEEIEVSVQNASAGKRNHETGEIKWEFKLKPSAKQEFELRYSVKYPKNKQIYIE